MAVVLGDSFLIFGSVSTIIGKYFVFDSIFFYLVLLVTILGVYSQLSFSYLITYEIKLYLCLSLIFSILCFSINHSIFFWCFYELSMLPLLFLIFKESPYSERFLAGWYFACYLLITSLPLILLLIYLSVLNGSFFFSEWVVGSANHLILILLSFVFFTKVPLVPFHTWLPIVHAEAISIVSIFLSGYIMKLGLLGVYRCSYFIFNFGIIFYLFLCFIFSVFFFITACGELDGKRWLAFLSLAHIVIPFFALFISDWLSINYCFFYCLGHGVSAGLVFGLLWYLYDLCNSRNWLLIKNSINGKGVMLMVVVSLLSLCSFPPTIQFFCEVGLIKFSSSLYTYVLFWCIYLFLGGLIPLVLCGHILIRSENQENFSCSLYNYLNFLFYLVMWCYLGVFLL
uniref:NADH-ubiquinone oxidoreductase chain 4 n=1 Tax=Drepanidotaenia lanceolata TaxID=1732538 RepID=A0A0N9Q5R5_9CEST|nr:NADH dehydrogenase subunit 4 [Drepanidotaenia lanceolata]ALH16572.1 NADH dehydrogenase subunit 4 [Drepanidotaenia lanceolata]